MHILWQIGANSEVRISTSSLEVIGSIRAGVTFNSSTGVTTLTQTGGTVDIKTIGLTTLGGNGVDGTQEVE